MGKKASVCWKSPACRVCLIQIPPPLLLLGLSSFFWAISMWSCATQRLDCRRSTPAATALACSSRTEICRSDTGPRGFSQKCDLITGSLSRCLLCCQCTVSFLYFIFIFTRRLFTVFKLTEVLAAGQFFFLSIYRLLFWKGFTWRRSSFNAWMQICDVHNVLMFTLILFHLCLKFMLVTSYGKE